ncbi:MAG TPA: HupE/UreJ family protein [Humisphaera sp.]
MLVLIAAVLAFVRSAAAHDEGVSFARVLLEPGRVRVVTTFHIRDLRVVLPGRPDAAYVSDLCKALGEKVGKGDAYVLEADFAAVAPRSAVARPGAEPHQIDLEVQYVAVDPQQAIQLKVPLLAAMPPGHQQVVRFEDHRGRRPADVSEETLNARTPQVVFNVPPTPADAVPPPPAATGTADTRPATGPAATQAASDAVPPPPERPGWRTFRLFFEMGVGHIANGKDHLLFLAALLVVCPRFRQAAAIISCFTLAHSVTLALAALNVVTLERTLVERGVAASIVYVALENLFVRDRPRIGWRCAITFAFGLVHGLAFAGDLRENGLGSDGNGVALPLVGFNLGVEAGQLAIAAVFVPVLLVLRRYPTFMKWAVPVGSIVIAVIGVDWLLDRTIGWHAIGWGSD